MFCVVVYVLGAGFSKAISNEMHLMSDLGEAVIQDVGLDSAVLEPFGGNVEMWLSYLAENQPWLSDVENLENHALFMRVSESIASFIGSRDPSVNFDSSETTRMGSSSLLRLVHKWCTQRNSVISFNYDLLVEVLVGNFVKHLDKRHLYGIPLVLRRDSSGMLASPPPDKNRPSLYKLHGSTNWLYGGVQDPYSPIVLHEHDTYGNTYDDLQSVIIPPTSSKSTFYNNAALRAQWRNAGRELANADRVVVIGYSMPESDLQVRSMLSTSLKADTEIVVIDPANSVAERIADHFPHLALRHFISLDDYIDDECDQLFFWFSTGSQKVEHFGRHGHYQSRRTVSPPSTFHTNVIDEVIESFQRVWPSVTAGPRRVSDGLTRLFVSTSDWSKQPQPWRNPRPQEVLDLRRQYPEIFEDLSDYQCRRMTRVFGGAWAGGWVPKRENLVELAEYLVGGRSREALHETFGQPRGSYSQRLGRVEDLDDDASMAEHLSVKEETR